MDEPLTGHINVSRSPGLFATFNVSGNELFNIRPSWAGGDTTPAKTRTGMEGRCLKWELTSFPTELGMDQWARSTEAAQRLMRRKEWFTSKQPSGLGH